MARPKPAKTDTMVRPPDTFEPESERTHTAAV